GSLSYQRANSVTLAPDSAAFLLKDQALPDLSVQSFTSDGGTKLSVTCQVTGRAATPFTLGIYLSADSLYQATDQLLGSVVISNAADLTLGAHTRTFTIGNGVGQIPLPGLGLSETNAQYSILAVADPTNQVAESDADPFNQDNTWVFAGAYHVAGGDVFVQ